MTNHSHQLTLRVTHKIIHARKWRDLKISEGWKLFVRKTESEFLIQEKMSNQDQNQAENANGDDDMLDLTADCVKRMEKYYAPGGLYEQQRERAENANDDEDILDLTADCLERMEKYYAPGGLYQQQQERNSKKQPEIKNEPGAIGSHQKKYPDAKKENI